MRSCGCWFDELSTVGVAGGEKSCCWTPGVGVLGMTRCCGCVAGAVVLVGGTVVGVAGTVVAVGGTGVLVAGTGVEVAGAVVACVTGVFWVTGVVCVTGVAGQGPCVAPGNCDAALAGTLMV
jgi:hypothetical protein